MSKYTTQLRWIVEQIGQGLPIPDGQKYADAVYKYIGLDKYPIFDDEYRTGLNDKIIDHFFFREIGFETAAQFSFYLRRTMNEIMPKYNALYKAQLTIDEENPLDDYGMYKNEKWDAHVDEKTVTTSETDTTESSVTDSATDTSSTTTDHNRNVYQDTPMSLLSNDGSPSVEGLDYATNVTYDDGRGTGTGTENNTTEVTSNANVGMEGNTDKDKDDVGERNVYEHGKRRSWADLMDEFAAKWQNIDMLVIADLEDLFMGVW